MSRTLDKGDVAFSGLPAVVRRLITEWVAGPFADEAACKMSLLGHLQTCAPTARITKEYRDGGTTADIHFRWQGILLSSEAFIEIKHNLANKSEFDRLVGQVTVLNPGKRHIFVVLCGRTEPSYVKWLEELFSKYAYSIFDPIIVNGGITILVK